MLQFLLPPSFLKQKRNMATKQKTYSEQLLHPKWQKKKSTILKRDEWQCQECGDDETTLHVHHKSYVYGNEVWDYPDTNFITLCEGCHQRVTVLKKEIKTLIDVNFITGDYLFGLKELLEVAKGMNPYDLWKVTRNFTDEPSINIRGQIQNIRDNFYNLHRDLKYFLETNEGKIQEIASEEPPF